MTLPFTHDQFLEVFAAYNKSLWPGAVVLWLATAWAIILLVRHHVAAPRYIKWLLAAHWAWAAVAYHAAYFSKINIAAWLFSGMFLIEAGLLAAGNPLKFAADKSLRRRIGLG